MNNFFGMLSRMKYINRWGLMRNNINENIAEHSLQVAIIAHGLAVIGNKRFGRNVNAEHIAMMGIMHDTTEIITGDLPTPIKYYAPEIRDAYKKVENIAANQLLKELPEDMQEAYEMAADALGLSLTTIDNEGETLPKASSADEITVEDGILVIVEFDIAEYRRKNRSRAVKKTLSIPEWLNEAAIRENLNFSQVLQDALMAKLGMNR